MEQFLYDHAQHDLRLLEDNTVKCFSCDLVHEGDVYAYEDKWGEGYGHLLSNTDPERSDTVELALHKLTCVKEEGCKCMIARTIEVRHNE